MAIEYNLKEKNTYILTFDLEDEDGEPISKSAISSFTLSLYYYNPYIGLSDRYHLDVINDRNQQDVLDANNVTITEVSGTRTYVTWTIQSADTTMLSSSNKELHVALFTWIWTGGKKNNQEVYLWIQKVPHSF